MTTTATTTPAPPPAALLIPVRGDPREITPQEGPTFTLAELQSYVGGYIELRHLPDGRMIVMNEEGKLMGLPVNDQATVLDLGLAPTDAIVGDVVVCRNELLE